MGSDQPLWQPNPSRVAAARLTAFRRALSLRRGRDVASYDELHRLSVEAPDVFWPVLWDFAGVRGEPGPDVVRDRARMPGARFYPAARLNFAENLLRRDDETPALVAHSEEGPRRAISWQALGRDVRAAARALRAAGVRPRDRVAGIVSNVPEAIVAALGAAAIGATWSSCSPDFGIPGVLDRFGQIEPVVLVAVDGYVYGGRRYACLEKLAGIVARLPQLRQVVRIRSGAAETEAPPSVPHLIDWDAWLDSAPGPDEPFEPFPFDHPLYILFSSGTTGVPKCIIHGAGGTLVQHLKEHQLHCDIRRDDRVFYFTTCGWMMWNWLVSVLASEATAVLYDGSPFHPSGAHLFDLADRERLTLFGTSAKFIDAVHKAGLRPIDTHDLGSVRTITSTGSPLSPESFDFVYDAVKRDVHLASISGGTDIVSCFVGGNPTAPVWRGEIQARGLGMDVDVFDETGQALARDPGELVCKSPFPSMPVGFWNDPDGTAYRAAYFARFPGVWCHGDWMRFTDHGGAIITGRSDATLKPGGVRIGTAEIYRQVEQIPEVLESLAIGQRWEADERIVLFVRLVPGATLDAALRKRISDRLRTYASPRHVPARIVAVAELPRTKSGKLVELAVRHVVHGEPVRNVEALANPETLDFFRNLPELAQ